MILRKFQPNELIFDVNETKEILRFIFKSKTHIVDKMIVDDRVKSFAQGLLLEAVDASYALGFIHALLGSVMNPGVNAKKVITKFGRKALKHWFKHAKADDLMNIKIYETVRRELDWAFGRVLIMHSNGTVMNSTIHTGCIAYKLDNNKKVWS